MKNINGYDLSRAWFDWCFENPERISPNHTALYFFIIEHCNRLGWKKKFGLPTTMAKEAIGIKSYNTYIKTLRELVAFGFVEMIEVSKNQYSSNIVALSKFNNAPNNALDKALIKHTSKQSESTRQSIDSIDKQRTNKPITNNNSKFNFKKALLDYEFDEMLVDEWLVIRKAKKSVNSQFAFNSFISQVEKTNMDKNEVLKIVAEKQWAGFNSNWLKNLNRNNGKDRRDSETADRERQIMQLARDAGMA